MVTKAGLPAVFMLLCISCAGSGIKSTAPDWATDAVWYQIFPERFRNGDPDNDPTGALDSPQPIPGWQVHPWGSDFYERQPWEINVRPDNFYWMHTYRRYGGDFQGIIDKLDYLADLGVNAIYINPIFNADSHHKYDGSTYHHMDYYFGPDPQGDSLRVAQANETDDPATWIWTSADKLFLTLLQEAHDRGIKIVTDGVFNHIGRSHFAFQDVMANQQESPYANWFEIEAWDDPGTPENEFAYGGWWGVMTLPEINEENGTVVDGPKQYIYNSVARWMDPNGDGDPADGIDGWRLDVVTDMGIRWWREWHAYIRTVNPNIFTTAEIWDINPELLEPDLFTSSMNYPFAMAVLDFVGDVKTKITPSQFTDQLGAVIDSYGLTTVARLQDLIDSHDTDRLPSILMNPDRNYDREARPDQHHGKYDISKPGRKIKRLQKLIVALQATWVGAPMIYYGDEVGMWGEDDPGARKPMLWDDISYEAENHHPLGHARKEDSVELDLDLRDYYRRAFRIRHEHSALRGGDYDVFLIDDDKEVFGFKRWNDEETLLVITNNSDQPQKVNLESYSPFSVVFSLGECQVSTPNAIEMEGRSFLLLASNAE